MFRARKASNTYNSENILLYEFPPDTTLRWKYSLGKNKDCQIDRDSPNFGILIRYIALSIINPFDFGSENVSDTPR